MKLCCVKNRLKQGVFIVRTWVYMAYLYIGVGVVFFSITRTAINFVRKASNINRTWKTSYWVKVADFLAIEAL